MQIMKKKLLMVFAALLMTVSASAQFEEGKMYCGASLTGLYLVIVTGKQIGRAHV